MQGYIEKHLLGMTSLLPPCVGSVRLCPKSHVFGISCHAKHTVQQDCMSISWLCWQTLCYQDATFWWVESKFFFFPSHSTGDKGQNENFENSPSVSPAHHHSWTSWSYYPARIPALPSLTAASSPWATSLSLQQLSHSSKAQGSLISQNNLTAGRDTSFVGWRCGVPNITRP